MPIYHSFIHYAGIVYTTSTLLWQPVWEKENSEFKTVKFHLKLTLCRILLVWRLSKYICMYIFIYM